MIKNKLMIKQLFEKQGKIPMRNEVLILILVVLALSPLAKAETEIVSIFSDFTSGDVTIKSSEDINGKLVFESSTEKGLIESQTIPLQIAANQTISKVIIWGIRPQVDIYNVKVSLYNGDVIVTDKSIQVTYGSVSLPSYRVVDFAPSNKGVQMLLEAVNPSAVDMRIELIDNSNIVFTTTKSDVALDKDVTNGIKIDWPFPLNDNNEYTVRGKITLRASYGPPLVNSYISRFVAKNDVQIIPENVKVDEYGASVTLVGESQVPFDGFIDITVRNLATNEIQVYRQQVDRILLSGREDTTGVVWSGLKPGKYDVQIRAVTVDNISLAEYKTILRMPEPQKEDNQSVPTENTNGINSIPGFEALYLIMVFGIIIIIKRQKNRGD